MARLQREIRGLFSFHIACMQAAHSHGSLRVQWLEYDVAAVVFLIVGIAVVGLLALII